MLKQNQWFLAVSLLAVAYWLTRPFAQDIDGWFEQALTATRIWFEQNPDAREWGVVLGWMLAAAMTVFGHGYEWLARRKELARTPDSDLTRQILAHIPNTSVTYLHGSPAALGVSSREMTIKLKRFTDECCKTHVSLGEITFGSPLVGGVERLLSKKDKGLILAAVLELVRSVEEKAQASKAVAEKQADEERLAKANEWVKARQG